jgi:hypothetical protein
MPKSDILARAAPSVKGSLLASARMKDVIDLVDLATWSDTRILETDQGGMLGHGLSFELTSDAWIVMANAAHLAEARGEAQFGLSDVKAALGSFTSQQLRDVTEFHICLVVGADTSTHEIDFGYVPGGQNLARVTNDSPFPPVRTLYLEINGIVVFDSQPIQLPITFRIDGAIFAQKNFLRAVVDGPIGSRVYLTIIPD